MKKLLPLLLLSVLSACASQTKELQLTPLKPRPDPISAEVLRAMQPNSTDLLKRAEDWLASSKKLLDGETTN